MHDNKAEVKRHFDKQQCHACNVVGSMRLIEIVRALMQAVSGGYLNAQHC